MSRQETLAELAALAASDDRSLDLGEAALLLAKLDRPRVPLQRYRDEMRLLSEETEAAAGGAADLERRIEALTRVIAGNHGYRGDQENYDDPQNANLIRVIDRRRGLPVALGILYLQTGSALGWSIHGLNFPGHFVIRLEVDGAGAVLDPFNGGQPLDAAALRQRAKQVGGAEVELTPDFFVPVSRRDVLLRLQNNLKQRALGAAQTERAADVLESMAVLAPQHHWIWREYGLVLSSLGHMHRAIGAIERAIATAPNEAAGRTLRNTLEQLRHRLH